MFFLILIKNLWENLLKIQFRLIFGITYSKHGIIQALTYIKKEENLNSKIVTFYENLNNWEEHGKVQKE